MNNIFVTGLKLDTDSFIGGEHRNIYREGNKTKTKFKAIQKISPKVSLEELQRNDEKKHIMVYRKILKGKNNGK